VKSHSASICEIKTDRLYVRILLNLQGHAYMSSAVDADHSRPDNRREGAQGATILL
jgi:hypothetical protein